jgi:hypothetical protein
MKKNYISSFAMSVEREVVIHLRTFSTLLLSLVFAGTVEDPIVLSPLLSPLDSLKKELLGRATAPFPTPASNTIFSSMVLSPSIVFSSSEEELTLPAERDNITVQTSPQAVKTGISG